MSKNKNTPPSIKLGKKTLYLVKEKYSEGDRICIDLVTKKGELWSTATVNFPEVFLESNQVVIKTWSGNDGVCEAMVNAKILEKSGKYVEGQYVKAPICNLLIEL